MDVKDHSAAAGRPGKKQRWDGHAETASKALEARKRKIRHGLHPEAAHDRAVGEGAGGIMPRRNAFLPGTPPVDINIQGAKKQPLLINHWIAAVLTVAGMYIHLQPSKFSSFLFGKAKQDTPIESSSSTGSQEKISKDIGKEKTQ